MNKQRIFLAALCCALAILVVASEISIAQVGKLENPPASLQASQAPFTYQGHLKRNNQAFTGTCDMIFQLYDAPSGGVQVGSSIPLAVPVVAGLFTVNLDFGSASFSGAPRYLEILVQCSGETSYTNMGRHSLTPVPYATNTDLLDNQHAADFASSAALVALENRVTALEGAWIDNDGDLFFAGTQDCNDFNPAIHLGAAEICTDFLDNDCDVQVDCADSSCSPDLDSDGHHPSPCGGDCDDSAPEIYPGRGDFPDPQGLDENCDGIDGEENNAVFVSTSGNDGDDGSRLHPKFSIQAGIDTTDAPGKRDIYVAAGTYTGQVNLAAGKGVYGGYSPNFSTVILAPTRSIFCLPTPLESIREQ